MSSNRNAPGLGMQLPPLGPHAPLNGCITGSPAVWFASPLKKAPGFTCEKSRPRIRPKARSSWKLIIVNWSAVVAQRPFSTITAWAKVASGLKLSTQNQTPLNWQLSGSLAPEPYSVSITEPSASKTTPTG